jgi:geranylgeranyl diphosphate synthase, type II
MMVSAASEREQRAYALIDRLGRDVNDAINTLDLGGDLPILDEPIRYVLSGGGKRFRPVLVLLAAGMWDVPFSQAMPAALSVEVFHNFTLVHDDIMDHSEERRGRATVHRRWDESTAILSGDYMLGVAYGLLARVEKTDLRRLMSPFQRMVRLLCEGQALDKWFETQEGISVDDYFRMIHAKTGALVECALELGGIIANASESDLDRLRGIGRHMGRAFQLQDDLLDVVATDAQWGKPVGGDLVEGKRTYIVLRALEVSHGADAAFFSRLIAENGIRPSAVPEARERLMRLGVLDETAGLVSQHSVKALDLLDGLPESESRDALQKLIERMRSREH